MLKIIKDLETQFMKIIKDYGVVVSMPYNIDQTKRGVSLVVTDFSKIDNIFNEIYLIDSKKENIKISLDLDTSLCPEQSMFEYFFETVEDYIDNIFKNKVVVSYEDKIIFNAKTISLELQARSAIKKISEPSIVRSDKEFIDCLIGDQLYFDHYNSPILDSLHNEPCKIIVKKSTNQIFIYGTPNIRKKICNQVTKYVNDPINKVYTYKIPIFSHSESIASYIKNIKPLLNYHDCVCESDENYVTIKKVGSDDQTVTQLMQQVVSNIISNTLDTDSDINKEKCILCFNKVVDKADLDTCSCIYCKECFRQLLFTQQTKCISCFKNIKLSDLKFFNDLEICRIFTPILEKFLIDNKQYVRCLTPECNGIYTNTGCKFMYCTICSHVYCLQCQNNYYNPVISHDGLTCDEYVKHINMDSKSQKWLNKNTRKCPECRSTIQRTEGCLHMICRQCKYEFCWDCLDKWSNIKHSLYKCTADTKYNGTEYIRSSIDGDDVNHYDENDDLIDDEDDEANYSARKSKIYDDDDDDEDANYSAKKSKKYDDDDDDDD